MAISAVVYVDGLDVMGDFYARTFGLQRVDGDDTTYVELSDGSSSLVIHATPPEWPAASGDEPREDAAVKISLEVADMPAAIAAAAGFGVELAPAGWQWHGHDVYGCVDPEGNLVQAVQR